MCTNILHCSTKVDGQHCMLSVWLFHWRVVCSGTFMHKRKPAVHYVLARQQIALNSLASLLVA